MVGIRNDLEIIKDGSNSQVERLFSCNRVRFFTSCIALLLVFVVVNGFLLPPFSQKALRYVSPFSRETSLPVLVCSMPETMSVIYIQPDWWLQLSSSYGDVRSTMCATRCGDMNVHNGGPRTIPETDGGSAGPHRCTFQPGWALYRRVIVRNYFVIHVKVPRLAVLP